ncbi:MAG TPA: 4Fe-4S dicluster domain-containing protein, partial [Phycisphaerae bacterium]|nr:4Fe-4S dicluster domain-containing protein [Phycisphaerae bacterium]
IGGNPVYTAPADLNFGQRLLNWALPKDAQETKRLAVHLSTHYDETSLLSHWHVPRQHYLESWGDVRAYDGTVAIVQPLIAPLFGGKSDHEMLALLTGNVDTTPHALLRDYWRRRAGAAGFDAKWDRWLEKGVVPDTTAKLREPAAQNVAEQLAADAPAEADGDGLELVFQPDPTIWDGCFANNGWQQELPKPMTHLTWDNAALMGVQRARKLGLGHGDIVKLQYAGRTVEAPVLLMPGQHDEVVTVTLGYGRWQVGEVGEGAGFNAYALRTAGAPWFGGGLRVSPTGGKRKLANVDMHHVIVGGEIKKELQPEVVVVAEQAHAEADDENRRLVRTAPLPVFNANPRFAKEVDEESANPPLNSMFPQYAYKDYKWGMTIDLTSCNGCMACVVGCQAENNSPVVGKEQVLAGREMHWLRVDKYFKGDAAEPEIFHQPVPCMQCENAPCELVCPVGATVHDHEGINNMVYNRCVGTRYCSNNCPYKVRRFNFLKYSDDTHATIALQKNPNVTVRSRGVMEKCTYCIQRISAARIEAEKEDRRIRDGELQTACQQACPTGAIVFGDLNDPKSHVHELKQSPLEYGMLTELTTVPRTTYLARVTNPNPALDEGHA